MQPGVTRTYSTFKEVDKLNSNAAKTKKARTEAKTPPPPPPPFTFGLLAKANQGSGVIKRLANVTSQCGLLGRLMTLITVATERRNSFFFFFFLSFFLSFFFFNNLLTAPRIRCTARMNHAQHAISAPWFKQTAKISIWTELN